MWVFTYSVESLHHQNYKCNSKHSTWTSYMEIISYTINLFQIKTSVTRTSRHSFLAKNSLDKPPPKTQPPNCKVKPLLICRDFIFMLIWMLGVIFSRD